MPHRRGGGRGQIRSVQLAEQAAALQKQLDDLDKRIREFKSQARGLWEE